MVMDFGAEKEHREGAIYLVNNTIVTAFQSPIVNLTAAATSAHIFNNVIENNHESQPILVGVENGAKLIQRERRLTNVIAPAYSVSGTALDTTTLYTDTRHRQYDPTQDRRPLTYLPGNATYLDGEGHRHEATAKYHHSRSKGWEPTKTPHIGAGD